MGGATYYAGSDGNWYAKCTENAYSADYTYSNGTKVNQIGSKKFKYFKVEPIKWRVLNPGNKKGNKILLAEKALTANVPYYGTIGNRTLNEIIIYPNNYMYSNIRAYLNGTANQFVSDGGTARVYDVDWTGKGFFQTAFTSAAQGLIVDTQVDNSAASTNPASNAELWNSGKNTYACGETKDKIFLLSEKEVTASDYGFEEYDVYISERNGTTQCARVRKPTDFAIANYASYDTSNAAFGVSWWLRSPSRISSHAGYVYISGLTSVNSRVDEETGCIVPALSISAK